MAICTELVSISTVSFCKRLYGYDDGDDIGLNQNKANSGLLFIQRLGNKAYNCEMARLRAFLQCNRLSTWATLSSLEL